MALKIFGTESTSNCPMIEQLNKLHIVQLLNRTSFTLFSSNHQTSFSEQPHSYQLTHCRCPPLEFSIIITCGHNYQLSVNVINATNWYPNSVLSLLSDQCNQCHQWVFQLSAIVVTNIHTPDQCNHCHMYLNSVLSLSPMDISNQCNYCHQYIHSSSM